MSTISIFLMCALGGIGQAEWSNGFRGPDGSGDWKGKAQSWPGDAKEALWRVPMMGAGWAAPVTSAGKVYVASVMSSKVVKPSGFAAGVMDTRPYFGGAKPPKEEHSWKVTSFDAYTGKFLWETTIESQVPKFGHHSSNTYATETPITNGKVVGCWFGSCGMAAGLDAQTGKLLWKKDLGTFPRATGFGTGSSPASDGKTLFVQNDNDKQSSLVALDLETGKELWRLDRKLKTSWSTPLVWRNKNRTELVVCGEGEITSHEPKSGKELWRYGGIRGAFATSPSADENILIACKSDPSNPGTYVAIRPGFDGDLSKTTDGKLHPGVAWTKSGSGPGLGSPVLSNNRFFVSNSAILSCLDAQTGKELWKERLSGAKNVTASVWALGDTINVLDEAGNLFVVANEPKFRLIQKCQFGDLHWSTPDLATGNLILRGVNELLCVKPATAK